MREISDVWYERKFDCIELKVVGLYFRFSDDREKYLNTKREDVHIDGLGQNSV